MALTEENVQMSNPWSPDPVPPLDSYPVMMQKLHQPVDENTIGKRLESTVGRVG